MSVFRDFEQEALRLLAESRFGPDFVATLICDADLVSIEYSGVGYFLTVRHESLPQRRIVLHEPFVVGQAGEVQGTYLAFIENGELMLECAPVPPSEVREGFRDMPVSISIEKVADSARK
jgi:hypothetical protein